MNIDLMSAGLVQGFMWRDMSEFIDSVAASMPFWWVRTFSGIMIFVGQVLFVINLYMTVRQQPSKVGYIAVNEGTASA